MPLVNIFSDLSSMYNCTDTDQLRFYYKLLTCNYKKNVLVFMHTSTYILYK